MITAILPWPPKELSPNTKSHWAKKARAVKAYKTSCLWECKLAKLKKMNAKGAYILIKFYPPDNRVRDTDNMIAAIKPAIDAISDSIGIDDSKFVYEFLKADKTMNGAVHIAIFPISASRRIAA